MKRMKCGMPRELLIGCWILTGILTGHTAEVRPLSVEQRREYAELSPFEFKNILIDTAKQAGQPIHDAGRGNPNFINTRTRHAFAMLHRFAIDQARAAKSDGDLGFPPEDTAGIAARFENFLAAQEDRETAAFLADCAAYAKSKLQIPPDIFVGEMADAITGDHYPTPSRMLATPEKIVEAYLKMIHFPDGRTPPEKFDLFATEGATAAMIYVFNTLKENFLLNAGDQIAIITPIFSPYIEIPVLNDFELKPVYVSGSETEGWRVSNTELEKLKDPRIKALFMVNPMNPGAVSMHKDSVAKIAALIKAERTNLFVLTDTVYCPFVDEFHDIIQLMPQNCIGVFSFSKYVGVTGWRLGVIFVQPDNVFDRMLRDLPADKKALLRKRYGTITDDTEGIPFIERLLMDSRAVALAHTGGLSTPQQCIMALFSMYDMLDQGRAYKQSIRRLLAQRMDLLYKPLGIKPPVGPDQTHYYNLVNLHDLAMRLHGAEFTAYLTGEFTPFDLLIHLAREYQTVLLPGVGFAGPEWSARVSLANLPDAHYTAIGGNLVAMLNDYFTAWRANKAK